MIFLRLLRTFNGSFLWSKLFQFFTFLFQIDVFFQTDDIQLRQRQPQVFIVYVMVCIYISIILLVSSKKQSSQIKLMQIAHISTAFNDTHSMHNLQWYQFCSAEYHQLIVKICQFHLGSFRILSNQTLQWDSEMKLMQIQTIGTNNVLHCVEPLTSTINSEVVYVLVSYHQFERRHSFTIEK